MDDATLARLLEGQPGCSGVAVNNGELCYSPEFYNQIPLQAGGSTHRHCNEKSWPMRGSIATGQGLGNS